MKKRINCILFIYGKPNTGLSILGQISMKLLKEKEEEIKIYKK